MKFDYKQKIRALIESIKMIGTDPYIDWRVIVIVSLCGVCITAAFSVYVYREINRESFFVVLPEDKGKIDTIDRDAMKNIIDYYEARKVMFEDIKKHSVQLPDPSI
jgi:hypothetical protein